MHSLAFCIIFVYIFVDTHGADDVPVNGISISDIADGLLSLFHSDNETERIRALKEKKGTIDNYALDKEKYTALLIDETKNTGLNQTNFFEALNEKDYFQFHSNDTRNLYLKLKEKMNRDDVLKILADNTEGRMMKSARRMLNEDFLPNRSKEKEIEEVVDEIIAEAPTDDHKYEEDERYSSYWDPESELKELQSYHSRDGRRLFKGQRTNIRHYPFMVSVHVMGRFWCGGAIVWRDLVLTTAACLQLMHNNRFFRENPRVLGVRVGSNHSRIGGELVDALEVYFHPSYNPRTLRNNIAIIRLRMDLSITHHRVPKVVEFAHNADGLPYTAEVLLLGWGVTKTSQKLAYEPIFLQRKVLPVYPNKFCKEIYGDKFVQSTMFCAGTLTTGEGACDHDAGGPAVMFGRLVGLISFGPAVCGQPNVPTAFTLVGAYADWIESVNESMPGYYRGNKRTTTTAVPLPLDFSRFTTRGRLRLHPFTTRPGARAHTSEATTLDLGPLSPGFRVNSKRHHKRRDVKRG